jgi:RNA polymerase sigma factor (sigma-70 family)
MADTTVDILAPRSGRRDRIRVETPTGYDWRAMEVRAALDRLESPTDRAITVLRFFVGKSLEEIARSLKIETETVRERYTATVRKLEQQLADLI